LLDIFAAAVWTDDLAFLVVNEGQDFVEDLLAVAAQEFVVGHGDLHSDESDKENSRRADRTVQCGSSDRAAVGSILNSHRSFF
jgi:hypothetical protein